MLMYSDASGVNKVLPLIPRSRFIGLMYVALLTAVFLALIALHSWRKLLIKARRQLVPEAAGRWRM